MINTVKAQGNGYLVDGVMSVPKDTGNRDYQEVLEWIASGNVVLPEYTDEELEAKAIQTKLAEAQSLLDSTQFKFGDDYDQKDTPEWLALKVKRQEAREFIRSNDVPNP